jgi:phosphohistidine swiveling domain-containing protein
MATLDPPIGDVTSDPAFPVTFEPGEEALEWDWDDMHTPRAVPPLSQDYLSLLCAGMAAPYREVDLPFEMLVRFWNGYVYFAQIIHAPEEQHEALRASAPDRWRSLIPMTESIWSAARAELAAMYADVDAISGEEPAPQLGAGWDRAWAHAARAWEIHFVVISGPYQVLEDVIDRYGSIVENAGPADGLELVSTAVPELAATDRDLAALTVVARGLPEIAARLRVVPPPDVDALEAMAGGETFAEALRAFLSVHGHLGTMREDLGEPSWNEDPRPLLGDIGRRLAVLDDPGPDRAIDRTERAERRASIVQAALADRPDELAEFEALVASACAIGHLTEGHNYWIDRMCSDRLRRLTRRVGRRLVVDGVIADAEDIVFLRRAEVAELIRTPVDARWLIEERKTEHRINEGLRPPAKLGNVAPPDPNRRVDPFDGPRFAAAADGSLRGTGASAGVVRGVARLVRGPDDFDRVIPGDIVVATASNPGWLPLFAIAGGFVTDTGGVLSHAAVVAREFGVPAVVGTRDGTRRIADGSHIEIDGTTGIVRLA